MRRLSYDTLNETGSLDFRLEHAPERVLQFGEGNFLRAFADDFFDIANEKAGFNGKIVAVTPRSGRLVPDFAAQDCLYTLYLRGIRDGRKTEERRLISSISRCLDSSSQFDEVLLCAMNPDLEFIVSNTTEAGIVFCETDRFDLPETASFPGKLTRFLYERFIKCGERNASGFVLLPCELNDENGRLLKDCAGKYADLWMLGEAFKDWLDEKNIFCNTLVDRIVPGYPAEDAERYEKENGYSDSLMTAAEPFGFWAIEGDESLNDRLPFKKCGLPVIVTPDIRFYKQRKVRVLNGGHTAMCATALLAGLETVGECMEDEQILKFFTKTEYEEIIPASPLDAAALKEFAVQVTDRFRNPFIRHLLMSISLNTTAKWQARVLPSVRDFYEKTGRLPEALVFGFAANLEFGVCGRFEVRDDPAVTEFFKAHRDDDPDRLMEAWCAEESFGGGDLTAIPGFRDAVRRDLENIRTIGVREALGKIC